MPMLGIRNGWVLAMRFAVAAADLAAAARFTTIVYG
jgi:hypothetical protein